MFASMYTYTWLSKLSRHVHSIQIRVTSVISLEFIAKISQAAAVAGINLADIHLNDRVPCLRCLRPFSMTTTQTFLDIIYMISCSHGAAATRSRRTWVSRLT